MTLAQAPGGVPASPLPDDESVPQAIAAARTPEKNAALCTWPPLAWSPINHPAQTGQAQSLRKPSHGVLDFRGRKLMAWRIARPGL
jgi:hypothetical protein